MTIATVSADRRRRPALGPTMRITTEYSDIDIEALAPGLALVRSLFESTLQGEGGFEFNYGGAMTTVWVHEADGWRILSGHTSAPVPRGGAGEWEPHVRVNPCRPVGSRRASPMT